MENLYHQYIKDVIPLNRTQKKICDQFLKLYESMSFDQITIVLLCRKVKIARTTFYAYFDSVYDVLNLIEDNCLASMLRSNLNINNPETEASVYQSYIKESASYFSANSVLLKTLLFRPLSMNFIEKWKNYIKYHYFDMCSGDEYKLELTASNFISTFSFWLKHDIKITDSEINRVLKPFFHFVETL